ncbi:MAG TPA: hypothetical protein VI636_19920 [Candidatus Angelobacter sp.]
MGNRYCQNFVLSGELIANGCFVSMAAVAEISDLILRGDHREAGVSDQDALDWLGHHLRTVRQIHGPDALNSLKRLAHGIAATHFRRRSQ